MPKLDEQITALETRLKALRSRQQRITARQRALEARRNRKTDTRRKILVGTAVLARVEQGRLPSTELRVWLDEALTRVEDRALFKLPERSTAN